ncbi:MAG: hypothetical protein JO340_21405 [Acidobacteriaceae bacterium]|nr:hypothetical protein [Acidobacteriaceae bacterium]
MLHFYIAPWSVWKEPHGDTSAPRYNLFRHSHWFELQNGLILISGEFDDGPHGREKQSQWHAHPEVARLPHPIHEASVPLVDLHSKPEWAHKQYKPVHHDALKAGLKIEDSRTVWDVHERAKAIHPLVRLEERY